MEGEHIPGVSRQDLKKIKAMSLPEFRHWALEYSNAVYNEGIADCLDALKAEFGFGKTRLQRVIDHIAHEMDAFAERKGKA